MENQVKLTKKGLIMLFYGQIDFTGRQHSKYGVDESYMCTDAICSSYLGIDNSHTHTYLRNEYS